MGGMSRRRWGITAPVMVLGVLSLLAGGLASAAGGVPQGRATPTCLGLTATRVGTAAAETINGTAGVDVIVGLGGNDRINGLGGDDRICGGDGDDIISGGSGNDRVQGGTGNDIITGGAGGDVLKGGAGVDSIRGSAGGDTLFGEAGYDVLDGGLGRDTVNGGLGGDICFGEIRRHCELLSTTGRPAGGTAAVLESVTDGDTLRVLVGGRSERLRLVGINTPETDECLAVEAADYLAQLLQGRVLTLVVDVSDRDQYDRLLRLVWADGVFVNEALVRSGFAIARRYPPDLGYADLFDEAQADAQQNQWGMWAADACGPAANTTLVITHIEYDAPGDDSQNLNGEWVTLHNNGTAAVDLGGWVLKDESASHRYTFPAGFVLLADGTVNVYSGCGENASHALYWCNQGSGIWNNDGDTAYLLDPAGNIVTYLGYDG